MAGQEFMFRAREARETAKMDRVANLADQQAAIARSQKEASRSALAGAFGAAAGGLIGAYGEGLIGGSGGGSTNTTRTTPKINTDKLNFAKTQFNLGSTTDPTSTMRSNLMEDRSS